MYDKWEIFNEGYKMTLQEEFKKETGIRLIHTDEGNGFIEDYVFWLERKIESKKEAK